MNFTDNWTNVETLWTPSPSLSFHNNTFFLYHDRIYHDASTYTYVPATNQVRRTKFRDINNTYETQYGDTGYLKTDRHVHGPQQRGPGRARPQPQLLPPLRQRARRHVAGRRAESRIDGNYLDFYNIAATARST